MVVGRARLRVLTEIDGGKCMFFVVPSFGQRCRWKASAEHASSGGVHVGLSATSFF